MKLHVVHRTRYEYPGPVIDSYNEARLQPVTANGQVCHSFLLKVLPTTRLSHYLDFYLNCVHYFEVPEPHTSLVVEAASTVTTSPDGWLGHDAATAAMRRLPECLREEQCYDFLQSSTYVHVSPEVWRLAVDACQGVDDIWQAALAIMHFVHREFTYTKLATTVKTHMTDVINQRRGVCQDFAHVVLGMCRAMKIPARYVSGYILSGSGPGEELTGCLASHAWCEVFIPGFGWRALDPTNDQGADERYVKVATGRDYHDIIPIQGNYRGPPAETMVVEVEVMSVE